MAGFQDLGPEEISTDEVLRAGEVQLESSREVLGLMDDALRKSAEIVNPQPAAPADDDILLVEESDARGRRSPHESWRF